jgi:hypothetical protein
MATTHTDGFNTFIGWLTPTDTDRAKAASHRQSIYDKLDSVYGLNRMFQSGSFSHGTGVKGYSDVDYFASLKSDRPELSSSILSSLKATLQSRFPSTTIRVSRPAVVLEFGGGYETVEIIPAYASVKVNTNDMKFRIPGVGGPEWLESTPEAHLAYVNACNKKPSNGHAKNFARLVKAWKYHRDVPISSFYLEMRAAAYIASRSSVVYAYDLFLFLKHLQDIELRPMQDPTGSSGYIYSCSSDANLKTALSRLDTAVGRASKAVVAVEASKIEDAFTQWDLLFNGQFPGYY